MADASEHAERAAIDRVLNAREVGARLAAGPWQQLPRRRIAVPVVAYMSFAALGEYVFGRVVGKWKLERAERSGEEINEQIFAAGEGALL